MVEENKKKETDGVKELRSMTTELNKQKENEKFQEIKKKRKGGWRDNAGKLS